MPRDSRNARNVAIYRSSDEKDILTKEEASNWTNSILWSHALMQLRQPKNVVGVAQEFLQCHYGYLQFKKCHLTL